MNIEPALAEMTFPPYYQEGKIFVLCIMFILFFFAFAKEKYFPLSYLIVLSFMPGTLFAFVAAMRFELIFFILATLVIIIKQKYFLFQNPNPVNQYLIWFFLIMFLSVFQAFDISNSWDYFYRLGIPMFFFYALIVCFCNDGKDLRALLYVYIFIMIWHAHLPVFNYLTGTHSFGHERLDAGLFHNVGEVISGHVGLANTMSQSLPVPFYLFFYEKNKILKILCFFAFILFLIAILASGSRGGFFGLVVCIGLFVFRAKKKMTALLMGVLLMIVFLELNPNQIAWYESIFSGSKADLSAESRIIGLEHGIQMAIKRPLLGVGIGCFAPARGAWFGWSIWAHNHYGELIGELGLLGLITWVGFIIFSFKEMAKIREGIKGKHKDEEIFIVILNICWVILVLRLILGMTTHSLLSFIWYMVAGMIVVTARIIENTASQSITLNSKNA